ncbi:probable regulator of nonsense transcripts 1 homolog at C-terminar half [Coccomyxa sp. Obi]|nr:probable regulator of nonsense transcripts 1 homolog at C-terminar half [Coccomyxa sp. Obi]
MYHAVGDHKLLCGTFVILIKAPRSPRRQCHRRITAQGLQCTGRRPRTVPRQCQVMSARRVVGATTGWDSLFSDQDASQSSNSSWDIITGPWGQAETPATSAAAPQSSVLHASVSPEDQEPVADAPVPAVEAESSEPESAGPAEDSGWGGFSRDMKAAIADDGSRGNPLKDLDAAAASEWFDSSEDAPAPEADPSTWWDGLLDPEEEGGSKRGPVRWDAELPAVLAEPGPASSGGWGSAGEAPQDSGTTGSAGRAPYDRGDGGARVAQGRGRGVRGRGRRDDYGDRGRGRREDFDSHRGGSGGSRWSESSSRGGSRWDESFGSGGSRWSEGSGAWASLDEGGSREWTSWDRDNVGGREGGLVQDSTAWEDPEEEESDGSVDIISGRQFSQVQAAAVKQWAELEAYSAEKAENTPEQEFLRAARKLQARLVLGVKAELDSTKEAILRLYRRSSTRQLKASGNVLTNLVGALDGRLYSNVVWRFTLDPRASQDRQRDPFTVDPQASQDWQQGPQQEGQAEDGPAELPELPYNRFSQGDGILLVRTLRNGELPEMVQGTSFQDYQSFEGTILEIRRNFLKIAFSRGASDGLEQCPADSVWRMDKYSPETTFQRQLKAIYNLDRPWEAEQKLQAVRAVLGRGAGGDAPAKELLRGFRIGEERVRKIVLGSPASPVLASTPPAWASDGSWRKDAREVLASLDGLNRSQQRAIATAMSSTFTLWQGPPGTGKTRTLLALLEILARISAAPGRAAQIGPILACADTNAATDNIVEGLLERGIRVTRMGQPAKAREAVRHATLEGKALQTPEGQKAQAMRVRAEEYFEMHRERGGFGAMRDPATPRELRDALFELKKRGNLLWQRANELVQAAGESVLRDSQVVCATCAGAGDDERLQSFRYKMVIVDEATQATEPSNIIPLVRGAECVVMAGDPKQLPPTLQSDGALDAQLDRTLFDRLQDSGLAPVLLDMQYRMHPLIAEYPSALFYKGKLKTGISAEERPLPQGLAWPNPGCPVMMVECESGIEERSATGSLVSGRGKTAAARDAAAAAASGSSYYNKQEAILAVRALVALMSAGDAESAAVLTPYNGQVRLIRSILKSKGSSLYDKVTVSSVDGYQGREADVIVFSAVRCNERGMLGFVADPRRLNVAITRPRRGLVVVGSPNTLSSDASWRGWIRWVRDHGAFATANALPLCPWESPDDDSSAAIDTSELAPPPEEGDLEAPSSLEDPAVAVADDEFEFEADRWAAASNNEVFAQSVGEIESGGQMREALRDVVVGEKGEHAEAGQIDGQEEATFDDSDLPA